MLKGISPLFSPELLSTIYRMGHGDEIVLGDAHFPGESLGPPVIRADGLDVPALLGAILPLFELDAYEPSLIMMDPTANDAEDPSVASGYRKVAQSCQPDAQEIAKLERFAFYERCRKAFAIVMTGDTRKYANLILKKGVTPG